MKTIPLAIIGCLALAATAWAGQGQNGQGIEIRSVAHSSTAPLRSLPPQASTWRPGTPPRVIPWRKPAKAYKPGLNKRSGGGKPGGGTSGGGGNWTDPDLNSPSETPQYSAGASSTSTPPTLVFQGQGITGAIPPDTNLAVGGADPAGITEIAQIVNTSYAVYDTSGATVLGSTDLMAIFGTLPASSNCNANGDGGDPIVLWDQFDSRWIVSQLAYNSDFSQNDFCVAISDGPDAAGSYEAYDFSFGNQLPDYPKLGVWSDGIYFSANMFRLKVNPFTGSVNSTFLGAQACSFPRPPSGTGTLPLSLTLTCSAGGNTAIYNILPADADGPNLPPTNSDYYLQFVDNLSSTSGSELMLYKLQSGTLVTLGTLNVGTFHEACGGGTCVPQLGTSQQLDSIGDRLMYRLSYRYYSDGTQRMVVNHSVQLSPSGSQTGIRWYEFLNSDASGSQWSSLCTVHPGTQTSPPAFSVCNQGTFDPGNSNGANYRWMGSIAQNSVGDLALGYSESSSSIYPSVAVTGMKPGESGMEDETQIFAGPNFQDTYSRWGDYSSMAVDPNDHCTFWYTTEYSTTLNLFGAWNFFWGTVIGNVKFGNCP